MRPKSGGLGNMVELKGKFRDYSLYCTIIHFGSFPVATARRHPKGTTFVHTQYPLLAPSYRRMSNMAL